MLSLSWLMGLMYDFLYYGFEFLYSFFILNSLSILLLRISRVKILSVNWEYLCLFLMSPVLSWRYLFPCVMFYIFSLFFLPCDDLPLFHCCLSRPLVSFISTLHVYLSPCSHFVTSSCSSSAFSSAFLSLVFHQCVIFDSCWSSDFGLSPLPLSGFVG